MIKPGDTLAGRFTIERLAGSGGMGKVFLARDVCGAPVAVKVLHRAEDEARFAREALVLAGITHAGVVRYVAHGVAGGEPFLVTEWLDGETLAARLDRGRISVADALGLGARVAGALSALHHIGVVHRDVKPSNVFLVSGKIEGATLLDLGIARLTDQGRELTATGAMIGTVGYMAPEQARGLREVDTRADVFALGCVLFRCLTGAPLFVGEDVLSVLLKVAFEEAPLLRDLRADVPEALEQLVAAMLAKDRAERPTAEAVADALAGVLVDVRSADAPPESLRLRLTEVEQRVASLVLAGTSDRTSAEGTIWHEAAEIFPERALDSIVERAGGSAHFLADGSLLVTLTSAGAATDLATRAVRCALAMRPFIAGTPIAVVSGRAVLGPRLPMGELIDRAAALLRLRLADTVRLDAATAALLGPSFATETMDGAHVVRGEEGLPDSKRLLLGRPTAFVGREREIATIEGLFTQCSTESTARAVLVTGEPGMGKSRLADEALRRLRQRDPNVEIWTARGDPMSRGSAFGMLGELLRRASGVSGGAPAEAVRAAISERARRHVPARDVAAISELLAEVAGAPVPEADASPRLRTARRDPRSLGEQMRRACEAFLAHECAVHPVVLVLEDLHWGDLPTIGFVDAALLALHERPIFVLALARPEVRSVFPGLWARREVEDLPLRKLARRASERFVRQVLGDHVEEEAVRAIVERSDGNVFYLEELIRAAAEGRGEGPLPDTVLAMVQSRLEAMEPDARRVLRAASVFGGVFWEGGIAALLGDRRAVEWLRALAQREVISPPREGRFPGEVEHAFRHALVQEAAYTMLTERDRTLAHRLAGEWLAAVGEGDAIVLAEHFERGGEARRAAVFYQRAAAQALRGNDLDAAVARAERGLATCAEGELRAELIDTVLEAHLWRNNFAEATEYAAEVFQRATPGSGAWSQAAMVKVLAAPFTGKRDGMVEAMSLLAVVEPREGATVELVQALSAAVSALTIGDHYDRAKSYLARMEQVGGPVADVHPAVRAWIAFARGNCALQCDADFTESLAHLTAARSSFEEMGSLHHAALCDAHIGLALWLLGAHAEAARVLRRAVREPRPGAALALVPALSKGLLASALADLGHLDEARAEATAMISLERAQRHRYFEGLGHSALADILRRVGDLPAAEQEALEAVALVSRGPRHRAIALARLSTIRLEQGRAPEALADARAAFELLAPALGWADAWIRLALGEALDATGQRQAACVEVAEARRGLLARAAAIADASLRASFLEQVPQHARVLALARAWVDEG